MRCPHIDVAVNRVFEHFYMGGPNNILMADSYLHWWSLAGVDSLVRETPAGWLETTAVNDNIVKRRNRPDVPAELPPLPEALLKKEDDTASQPLAPPIFPDDWTSFQNWLAKDERVPGAQWDGRRVLPQGAQNSPVMILTAWPEMDDQRSGTLFSGEAGLLLDRMMKAIGLSRQQCYCASLAITRPAGGRCDDRELPELQRLLRHHIHLAGPQNILLVGADIVRIMGFDRLQSLRGKSLTIDQNDQSHRAVAVPHPAMLISRPAQKAAAWDSLKLLIQRN